MVNRTMFGPTKTKYLGDIISLRTQAAAGISVRKLKSEYAGARTQSKRLRIARATQLAANRSRVMSRNVRLSRIERAEARKVNRVYDSAASTMFRSYRKSK